MVRIIVFLILSFTITISWAFTDFQLRCQSADDCFLVRRVCGGWGVANLIGALNERNTLAMCRMENRLFNNNWNIKPAISCQNNHCFGSFNIISLFISLFENKRIADDFITQNQDQSWFIKTIKKHLSSIRVLENGKIELIFNGLCPSVIIEKKRKNIFCKNVHNFGEFHLRFVNLNEKVITFEYYNYSNHHSIGKTDKKLDYGNVDLEVPIN